MGLLQAAEKTEEGTGQAFYDFTGRSPEQIAVATGILVHRTVALPPHDLPLRPPGDQTGLKMGSIHEF